MCGWSNGQGSGSKSAIRFWVNSVRLTSSSAASGSSFDKWRVRAPSRPVLPHRRPFRNNKAGPTTGRFWVRRSRPGPPSCLAPLEKKLRRELDLPRRTRVAGREPGIADHAERRAADRRRAARLAEVGLVEQVEDLDAELHARRARHL